MNASRSKSGWLDIALVTALACLVFLNAALAWRLNSPGAVISAATREAVPADVTVTNLELEENGARKQVGTEDDVGPPVR